MRPLAVLLGLLAALAAVALSGLAQVPGLPTASVEVTAEDTDVRVSVEAPLEVTITVENTMEATGSPFDQPREVRLSVTGAPAGWTATVSPDDVMVAPGETADATLTVTVAPGAADDHIELTVTARLQPLGGQDPSPFNPEASDTVTLDVQRSDPLTRDVIEGLGPWLYVVLLAFLVTILVLLRFVLAGRRVTVRLSTETRELEVKPGAKVEFPFRVENLTKKANNLVFQVSAMEEGWKADLASPELALQPAESAEISLTVSAPSSAAGRQQILVSAISVQSPRRPANLDFVAIAKVRPKP